MKTSTFKKKVEELGYETIGESGIDVRAKYGGDIVAFITGLERFSVYIYDYNNVTPELFELLVEYARTPIEERKDEKKYRLRLPFGDVHDILVQSKSTGNLVYSRHNSTNLNWRSVFTASEIAEIEKKYNLGSFEREEVIEDE